MLHASNIVSSDNDSLRKSSPNGQATINAANASAYGKRGGVVSGSNGSGS